MSKTVNSRDEHCTVWSCQSSSCDFTLSSLIIMLRPSRNLEQRDLLSPRRYWKKYSSTEILFLGKRMSYVKLGLPFTLEEQTRHVLCNFTLRWGLTKPPWIRSDGKRTSCVLSRHGPFPRSPEKGPGGARQSGWIQSASRIRRQSVPDLYQCSL